MAISKRRLVRFLLLVVILAIAVTVSIYLVTTRPAPSRRPRFHRGALVQYVVAERTTHQLSVQGHGEVVPAEQVALQAEVGGAVVWKSGYLVEGGMVQAGDLLVRLDDREYELAVEEMEAEVERARVALLEEEARGRMVRWEQELLGELGEEAAANRLASREPQLQAARQALEAARSGLERAGLNLGRTRVEAPFDGIIVEDTVDVGQVVSPQVSMATLVASDRFRVRAMLSPSEAAPFRLRDANQYQASILGRTSARNGETELTFPAKVLRIRGDLEPVARQVQVLLEVEDPLQLGDGVPGGDNGEGLLFLGSFVTVKILLHTVEDAFVLPAVALRPEGVVYFIGDDQRLEVRKVEVLGEDGQRVVVRGDIGEGDRVVSTPLPGAVPGMELRVRDTGGPDG